MSDPAPIPDPAGEAPSTTKRTPLGCLFQFIVIGSIFAILFGAALGPIGGMQQASHNAAMQQARMVGQLMFSYAIDNTDHNNAYPDGNSSTEVFQKLIDGGYCSDPSIFYIPLPGKTPAAPGQKLKPENVCFDVTSLGGANPPDAIPLLFMTGYKVTYAPRASAVPIIKPYPKYWTRTWSQWWQGIPEPNPASPGMAIFYKGNNAVFIVLDTDAGGIIKNFISPDYKPDGHTYRQLTPDGVLPP
jgi:hypothetical protein